MLRKSIVSGIVLAVHSSNSKETVYTVFLCQKLLPYEKNHTNNIHKKVKDWKYPRQCFFIIRKWNIFMLAIFVFHRLPFSIIKRHSQLFLNHTQNFHFSLVIDVIGLKHTMPWNIQHDPRYGQRKNYDKLRQKSPLWTDCNNRASNRNQGSICTGIEAVYILSSGYQILWCFRKEFILFQQYLRIKGIVE